MIFSFFLLVELFVAFTIERQRYIIILFFFLIYFCAAGQLVCTSRAHHFLVDDGGSLHYYIVRLQPLSRVIEAHIYPRAILLLRSDRLYAIRSPLDK